MNPLKKFVRKIRKNEFSDLPKWVNKKLFAQELEDSLVRLVLENYKENIFELNSTCLEGIMCPLVSDNVDLGASGGLEGKYEMVYEFPQELLDYLAKSSD